MPSPTPRLHGIEALRAYAACSIIMLHATTIHPFAVPTWFFYARQYLVLGVPMFFIISSFSLFYGYSGRLTCIHLMRVYYLRRFLRISPLFYFSLIIWTIYFYCVGSPIKGISEYFLNVSFLFNLVPGAHTSIVPAGWSIGVEMIFYAVLPILLGFVRSTISSALALATSIFLAGQFGSRLTVLHIELPFYYWTNFIACLPYFMFGALGFYLYEACSSVQKRKKLSYLFLAAAVVLGAFFVAMTPPPAPEAQGAIPPTVYRWGAVFLLVVLSQAICPAAAICNRTTLFLGKISFSLYLLHPLLIQALPVTDIIDKVTLNLNIRLTLNLLYSLLITSSVAWLTYALIEAPFMDLGRSKSGEPTEAR
jgi:peptidoglycan/LPS O-acetylase OafA/YrhL